MGQAAITRVIDSEGRAVVRKRKNKTIKRTDYYTGNLIAFNQMQLAAADKVPAVAQSLDQQPSRTAEFQSWTIHSSDSNDLLSRSVCQQVSELSNAKTRFPTRFPRPGIVAATIAAALVVGAIANSLWTPEEFGRLQPDTTVGSADNVTIDKQPQQVALQPPQPQPQPQIAYRSETAGVPVSLPIAARTQKNAEALDEAQLLGEGYLGEISWLRAKNNALRNRVDSLKSETVKLNEELLQFELVKTAIESDRQPIIEARTVYNFVNGPVGNTVVPKTYSDQYSTESDEYYEASQEQDSYSDEQQNFIDYQHTYTDEQYLEDNRIYSEGDYNEANKDNPQSMSMDGYQEGPVEEYIDETIQWDNSQ